MPLIIPNMASKMVNALPILKSYEDCADFSKTVSPYIPQLAALPAIILKSFDSSDNTVQGLKSLYIATNPPISTAALAIALTPIIWAVSEINKNYSQVDRLWSILPTLYISTIYSMRIWLAFRLRDWIWLASHLESGVYVALPR